MINHKSTFYLILLFFLINPNTLLGQKVSQFYLRAPQVLEGTLPEMRQASFWINRMENPDEILMRTNNILQMNEAYYHKIRRLIDHDSLPDNIVKPLQNWPGRIAVLPDLSSKSPEEIRDIVKGKITSEIDFLRNKNYGNIQGIEYSEMEIGELETEMNLTDINNPITVRYGITIKDAQLRIIPALRNEYTGLSEKNKTRWDLWNLDLVPVASLVEVLHISKSGGHLFVLSERGYGWIRSEEVALEKKASILEMCRAKNFVVCTGDIVPFYSDEACLIASGWLRMGDRIPLVKVSTNYKISVPTRKTNGKLLMQEAWLSKNTDVHVGYLPYTRRNIVLLEFKLLDRLYDWTGGWYGRNHLTQLRDAFRCFGFEFPSIGELLAIFNENTSMIAPEKGKKAQYEAVFSNKPFITIQISNGHSQLYLGEYEGEPLVFDTHGYGYTNPDGIEYEIRRSCIGTLSQPTYFLKNTIYFIELESPQNEPQY